MTPTIRPVQEPSGESLDPACANGMEALQRMRRLEGVTAQSKEDAIRQARQHVQFDLSAVREILQAEPSIRSAAFMGSVAEQSPMSEQGRIDILVDVDLNILPDWRHGYGFTGGLDEKLGDVFHRLVDSRTCEDVEYEIIHSGGGAWGAWLANSARVFYVR